MFQDPPQFSVLSYHENSSHMGKVLEPSIKSVLDAWLDVRLPGNAGKYNRHVYQSFLKGWWGRGGGWLGDREIAYRLKVPAAFQKTRVQVPAPMPRGSQLPVTAPLDMIPSPDHCEDPHICGTHKDTYI